MKLSHLSFLVLFLCSCSLFEQDTNETLRLQKEVYITQSDTLTLYRSLDYVSIKFHSDVDVKELNELIRSSNLQPVSWYDHKPFESITQQQVEYGGPIVLKVPRSKKAQDFYSGSKGFGDHPLLMYSIPVYSTTEDGVNWFYITNELMLAPINRLEVPESIVQTYKLEFLRYRQSTGLSIFRITDFSLGTPYEIAHQIKMDGEFRYVEPDAYARIVHGVMK